MEPEEYLVSERIGAGAHNHFGSEGVFLLEQPECFQEVRQSVSVE